MHPFKRRLILRAGGVLLLLVSALAGCNREATDQAGQADPPPGTSMMRDSSTVVRASITPSSLKVQPRDEVNLLVDLNIDKKWHLYAHEDTMFYGIDLQLDENTPLDDVQVSYPAGKTATFLGEKVQVLVGKQRLKLAGKVPLTWDPAGHELLLTMAVQACDDKSCLAPAFIPLKVALEVVQAGP